MNPTKSGTWTLYASGGSSSISYGTQIIVRAGSPVSGTITISPLVSIGMPNDAVISDLSDKWGNIIANTTISITGNVYNGGVLPSSFTTHGVTDTSGNVIIPEGPYLTPGKYSYTIDGTTISANFNVSSFTSSAVFTDLGDGFVLSSDGTLYGAGINIQDTLGDPSINSPADLTSLISGVKKVTNVGGLTIVIKNDGTVWIAGMYYYAGYMYYSYISQFTQIPYLSNIIDITYWPNNSSFTTFAALDTYGNLYSVGFDGGNMTSESITPELSNVAKISGETSNALVALLRDGTVWGIGTNSNYRLGGNIPLGQSCTNFTQIAPANNYVSILCPNNYVTYMLKNDGTVWAIGSNLYGNLGTAIPSASYTTTPVQIPGLTNVTEMDGKNGTSVFFVESDGSLWYLGSYYDSGYVYVYWSSYAPTKVSNISNVTQACIDLGAQLLSVVKSDGTVWTEGIYGYNQFGSSLAGQISTSSFTQVFSGVNPLS
jgi:alpha-tubulin suppressor-like RCC1 family protein